MSNGRLETCVLCGGKVTYEVGDYVTFVNGIKVVVPDTPFDKCLGCGEVYLPHESALRVQEAINMYSDKAFVLENKLRSVRESLGLSMDTVALRMGFSKTRYSQIETSKKAPGVYIAFRLAHVLGCDVNDLFGLKIAVRPEKMSLRSGKGVL